MNQDAVFWGSIISVVIAIVVFGFLAVKVVSLMNKDADKNKR
jgi:hypothetical protein